jgi:hypothetical protein
MVLFGTGRQMYASHIPMFGMPHDMQILMVVTVKHPALVEGQDFSDGTYTLRPQRFDLNHLVDGRLKSFKADVYRGNFEGDGVVLFRDALVQVEAVPHVAPLSANAPSDAEPRYWVLNEGCGVYLVHAISSAPDFDQVVKVSLARLVPRSGADLAVLRLPGRKNVSDMRLRAGEKFTAIREDGAEVPLTVERELSFLPGPDFAPPKP